MLQWLGDTRLPPGRDDRSPREVGVAWNLDCGCPRHKKNTSGLGSLQCLGAEVYGKWGAQCVRFIPALPRERARGLHPRIRRGWALGLQHRWWGILGIALQRAVAHCAFQDVSDLPRALLEPGPALIDLEIV